MRGHWILMTSALVASAVSALADGKEAFVGNGCNRCHAIASQDVEATASERMRGPDLSDIGDRHDVEWLSKYLSKEVELDGKLHRASFRGSDDERREIVDWLSGLKKPE